MKIVFMGTPDFAVPSFEALRAAGHELLCAYTQPPRRAGRGRQPRPSPVQIATERMGIEVRTPSTFRASSDADIEVAAFAALDADIAVVAAYGLILPQAILDAPRLGCVNVHASLLPRWRGAAPIQRAILAGDTETGVTIMQMDEGLDTGPMLLAGRTPIHDTTTGGELHDSLAALGAKLLIEALTGLEAGALAPTRQPNAGATYANKIDKGETRIDWSCSAATVLRQIHAFSPLPGAWFSLDGARVRALGAELAAGDGAPGTVLDERLAVACGSGAVRLIQLQRAGKGEMATGTFLRGTPIPVGEVLL